MKRSKGFTLVETVTVIAIILVLLGVAVPVIGHYISNARMIQYNDYAKTIFVSAQSYLTTARTAGRLEEIRDLADSDNHMVPADKVKPEYYEKDTSYLMLSRGGGSDSFLKELLGDYVLDPGILEQSICLEYNSRTGMVYSVSYSEVAPAFTYDSTGDHAVSICDRSDEARKKLKFGYYSTRLLEAPTNKVKLKESKIELINDMQLYCNWTDAQPDGETSTNDIIYSFSVYDTSSGNDTLLMRIKIPEKVIKTVTTSGNKFNDYLVECETTYYSSTEEVKTAKASYWIYRTSKGVNTPATYSLFLDTIDTSGNNGGTPLRNILTGFPGVTGQNIRVGISATGTSYAPNKGTRSNEENSLFHKIDRNGTIEISNARHLYNMHYALSDRTYIQLEDIDWKKAFDDSKVIYNEKPVLTKDVLKPDGSVMAGNAGDPYAYRTLTYFKKNEDGTYSQNSPLPFTGSYDGKGNTISNLYLTGGKSKLGESTSSSGLFALNNGALSDLTMDKLTLRGGTDYTGTVAASNMPNGTINDITVSAREILTKGTGTDGYDYTGGIAGFNEGKINGCTVNTESFTAGGDDAGGIIGMNSGSVTDCHVTVAGQMTGGDRTGGIAGSNNKTGVLTDCSSNVQLKGKSFVGGIAGINSGQLSGRNLKTSGGKIEGTDYVGGIIGRNDSVEYTELSGLKNAAEIRGKRYVGGIVGVNLNGKLTQCRNTGFVLATEAYGGGITGQNGYRPGDVLPDGAQNLTAEINDCVSAIVTGYTQEQLIKMATGDYIGGITGYNNGTITGNSGSESASISATVAGRNYVGGVVGHNDTAGKVIYCKVTGGKIIASNDFAGGFFGLNTSRSQQVGEVGMELVADPDLVQGNMYVGGAIGANLVASSDLTGTALTITVRAGEKSKGSVVALKEFAGGILGYNGVIRTQGSDSDIEKALQEALNELLQRKPYSDIIESEADSTAPKTVLETCTNMLNVTANRYVGGMIGYNSSESRFQAGNCINSGNLSVNTQDNKNRNKPDESYYIGGITGRNSRSGVIDSCNNNGNIDSLSKYTGGIVEVNNGLISKCANMSNISSSKGWVGGIVGLNGETNEKASVTDCEAVSSSIKAVGDYIGSIAGENKAIIASCTATNITVSSSGNYVGGIVGRNSGAKATMSAVKVFGTSAVKGKYYVGGIAGQNAADIVMQSLTNSAQVIGENYVGGIVGNTAADSSAIIADCTNTGNITAVAGAKVINSTQPVPLSVDGTDKVNGIRVCVGGITGENTSGGSILRCSNSGEIVGGGRYTGGIVSYNNSILQDCRMETGSSVRGAQSAGGIVGLNEAGGSIIYTNSSLKQLSARVGSSYNISDGAAYVGGLLAVNESAEAAVYEQFTFPGEISFDRRISVPSALSANGEKGQFAGGILGRNRASDTIQNCSFEGTINGGNGGSGGITGINYGTVKNITIGSGSGKASVGGFCRAGGIVGVYMPGSTASDVRNDSGLTVTAGRAAGGYYGYYYASQPLTINGMTNYASVKAFSGGGGLIGEVGGGNSAVRFVSCRNEGPITGSYTISSEYNAQDNPGGIGGITGLAFSSDIGFESCTNQAPIDGLSLVTSAKASTGTGGILGKAKDAAGAAFVKCVNKGRVSGAEWGIGGILGTATNTRLSLSECSNASEVYGKSASANYSGGTGGIIGIIDGAGRAANLSKCVNESSAAVKGNRLTGGIIGNISPNNPSETVTATLSDCINEGNISYSSQADQAQFIGGILGHAGIPANYYLQILNCSNGNLQSKAAITGGIYTGGVLGGCDDASMARSVVISNNKNYMTVKSDLHDSGGIIGIWQGEGLVLEQSENHGKITSAENTAGGMVGAVVAYRANGTVIRSCLNYGEVETLTSGVTGGITGYTRTENNGVFLIEECRNYASIYANKGSGAGGILGSVDPSREGSSVTIRKCSNLVLQGSNAAITQVSSVAGGIAGRFTGIGSITDCINEMPLRTENTTNSLGGIVGEWGGGSIINCENNAEIRTSASGVGGIAGIYNHSGNKNAAGIIDKCVNRGSVTIQKGTVQSNTSPGAGGILGNTTVISTSLTITNSTNTGNISADSAISTGGGIGAISSSSNSLAVNLKNLANTGNVTGGTSYTGGIAGWLRKFGGSQILLENSANFGSVQINSGDTGKGGIVGKAEVTRVFSCYNLGKVNASVSTKHVGGIVGYLYRSASIIENCVNGASVTAANSEFVGGIAGLNEGAVVASQNRTVLLGNTNEPVLDALIKQAADALPPGGSIAGFEDSPSITGSKAVGGITGSSKVSNTDVLESGIIYSNKSSETNGTNASDLTKDIVYNTMPVTAAEGAGGISGKIAGGSIVSAYNTGVVTAGRQAGGIAGSVESSGENKGGIWGTFSLGEVKKSQNSVHFGGIVGERSEGSKDTFTVSDSFYISKLVPETTVNTYKGHWRIGNEPFGNSSDPGGALDGPKKGTHPDSLLARMEDSDFAAHYKTASGKDFDPNWLDPLNVNSLTAAAGQYLRMYAPTLNAPVILSVTMNHKTDLVYTTTWSEPSAATDGYVLEYYEKDHPENVIQSSELPFDRPRSDTLSNDNLSHYIGKYFYVKIKAKGKIGENGQPITKDSEWSESSGPYLIVPPMLAPDITAAVKGVGTTWRLSLNNLSDYEKQEKPTDDYPALKTITDEALKRHYENYIDDLDRVVMIDPVNSSKEIPLTRTQADGYYLDYTFVLPDNVMEKVFTLTFYAYPKEIAANGNPQAAYCRSRKVTMQLTVYQTKKLIISAPSLTYTGTTASAEYTFSFKGDTNAAGYRVWLTDELGNEIARNDAVPKGTSPVVLINDTSFNDFKLSDYYGRKITAHVQAVGDGKRWLDSDEIHSEVTVVKKLEKPEIKAERVYENADTDQKKATDRYRIYWTGVTDGAGFSGTLKQTDLLDPAKISEIPVVPDSKVLEHIFNYTYVPIQEDTWIQNGFRLEGTLIQTGVLGVSIDSEAAVLDPSYEVKPRLPLDVQNRFEVKWDADNKLTLEFDLNKIVDKTKINPDNCEKIQLYYTVEGSGNTQPALLSETPADTLIFKHTFGPEMSGKKLSIYAQASGKDGISSDSIPGTPVAVLVAKKVAPPLNVVLKKPADYNSDVPVASEEELKKLIFELTWTSNPSNADNEYSGYTIQVVDGEETPVSEDVTKLITNFIINDSKGIFDARRAGNTLTVQVSTKSEINNSSDWVTVELKLPKIKLSAPSLRYEKGTQPDDYGTVLWKSVENATDYKAEGFDKDGKKIENLVITPPEEGSTTWSCKVVQNLAKVKITAIGNEHYADSDPAELDITVSGKAPAPSKPNGSVSGNNGAGESQETKESSKESTEESTEETTSSGGSSTQEPGTETETGTHQTGTQETGSHTAPPSKTEAESGTVSGTATSAAPKETQSVPHTKEQGTTAERGR